MVAHHISDPDTALDIIQRGLQSISLQTDEAEPDSSFSARIPIELLQDIFRIGLDLFPAVHGSVAPLLYGQVCRRWREVAYSTPELWSSIHIAVPLTVTAKDRADALISKNSILSDLVASWLARADERPLRISLFSKATSVDDQITRFLADFLSRISGYFGQCTYLRFSLPLECLNFMASNKEEMPMLETVILFNLSMPAFFSPLTVNPGALATLTLAPKLRNLSLSSPPDGPFRPTANWASLSTLALDVSDDDTFGPSEALNILAECPRLQSFTLVMTCLTWRWRDTTTWPAPLTLPALTKLRVDVVYYHFLDFLSRIVVPAIRDLSVAILKPLSGDSTWRVFNILRPTVQSTKLDTLKLTAIGSLDYNINPGLSHSIRSLLEAVPSLSSLTLDMGSKMIHEEVLTALTLKDSTPLPLCPDLVQVEFPDANASIGKLTDKLLESFFLSRLNPPEPVAQLRRFISPLKPSSSCTATLKEFDGRVEVGTPSVPSDTIARPRSYNFPFASVPVSLDPTTLDPYI
ncbi:hypothetical protein PM082_020589 [Marasmius tenuissimus]|nr:hypothetical protein PM082_020589 [Marasmius tenuissimus]